jgi:uncharacterized protein (DUF1684 family)
MTSDELQEHRRERDRFFAESYASPLTEEERASFTGLRYFPEDPTLSMRVPFHPSTGKIDVVHSHGAPRRYHLIGTVDVSLAGRTYALTVLDGGDDTPFLAIRDTTSGAETYEAGRYVPVAIHDDGTATVDFNLAHNPLCAYDEEFACPLPPPENVLPVPIRAGEKRFR